MKLATLFVPFIAAQGKLSDKKSRFNSAKDPLTSVWLTFNVCQRYSIGMRRLSDDLCQTKKRENTFTASDSSNSALFGKLIAVQKPDR